MNPFPSLRHTERCTRVLHTGINGTYHCCDTYFPSSPTLCPALLFGVLHNTHVMSGPPAISTENNEVVVDKFKPSRRFMAAFTSLATVNLACALDATDIGVALPVSVS
jgi:hypothetical protein